MKLSENVKLILARTGCAGMLLILSLVIAVVLIRTRAKIEPTEPAPPSLKVAVMAAEATNVVVRLESHGIARPLREVDLAAEISGRVVEMPRVLREGDLVKENELLLRIEPRDVNAALAEAEASLARVQSSVKLLEIEEESGKDQLEVLERSKNLARKDYERVRKLFEDQNIGSIALVEAAEQSWNQAVSSHLRQKQSLDLLPSRRQEVLSELRAAESRVARAELNVERSEIRAPFSGRIAMGSVEVGDLLQPGMMLYRLADDSIIEIQVPLPASDLRQWLPFQSAQENAQAWFPPLPDLPATAIWTEGRNSLSWTGSLDRIVAFDSSTRMATLAVRVEGDALQGMVNANLPEEEFPGMDQQRLPLTDGMFCRVELPGRSLSEVFVLPRASVTFDGRAYLSEDGKLRTVEVDVLRSEGDYVYVRGGLNPGDLVITTRLVAPLEGINLEHSQETL